MSITMSDFGLNGRLGNQLFQFSTLFAVAKKLNTNIFLYKRSNPTSSNFEKIDEFLQFDVENIKECTWICNLSEYQSHYKEQIKNNISEPHFHYMKKLNILPDNTDLRGYFQSEKYFVNFKDELVRIFSIKNPTKAFIKYRDMIENEKYISLHVRRGDYINLSEFHINLAETDYYTNSISYIKEKYPNSKYLIFSDDVQFCKGYFDGKITAKIEYVVGTSAAEEIILQSLCASNIIANSSFSWWGAWLNCKNGTVISPKSWFGSKGPSVTEDLYCNEWIRL